MLRSFLFCIFSFSYFHILFVTWRYSWVFSLFDLLYNSDTLWHLPLTRPRTSYLRWIFWISMSGLTFVERRLSPRLLITEKKIILPCHSLVPLTTISVGNHPSEKGHSDGNMGCCHWIMCVCLLNPRYQPSGSDFFTNLLNARCTGVLSVISGDIKSKK